MSMRSMGTFSAIALFIAAIFLMLPRSAPMGDILTGLLWGGVGMIVFLVLLAVMIIHRLKKSREPAAVEGVKKEEAGEAEKKVPLKKGAPSFLFFFHGMFDPHTILFRHLPLFGGAWLYSPGIFKTPNLLWIPLLLLTLWFSLARAEWLVGVSKFKDKNEQERKERGFGLWKNSVKAFGILSALVVGFYFYSMAPEEFQKLTKESAWGTSDVPTFHVPDKRVVPFEASLLAIQAHEWRATLSVKNPHYVLHQDGWQGKALNLGKGSYIVKERMVLTLVFDETTPWQNLVFEGRCVDRQENGRPLWGTATKGCAGYWRDQGGTVTGAFYSYYDRAARSFIILMYLHPSLPVQNAVQNLLRPNPMYDRLIRIDRIAP